MHNRGGVCENRGLRRRESEAVPTAVLIALLVVLVVALLWVQHRSRLRLEQESRQRRARTSQAIARSLLTDDAGPRHTVGRALPDPWGQEAIGPTRPAAAGSPPAIDILLEDEPTAVAQQARDELGRPTTLLSGLSGEPTQSPAGASTSPPLTLLDGRIEVPLEALVLAWFSARGYAMRRAPADAQPISLLLRHRDDPERSYAFYFERGRLQPQRAAAALAQAQALGMHRLLVAAEHGAEPGIGSGRLRDVLVMDWVALDREMRKLDFRVAAKLVALARTRRDLLGLA